MSVKDLIKRLAIENEWLQSQLDWEASLLWPDKPFISEIASIIASNARAIAKLSNAPGSNDKRACDLCGDEFEWKALVQSAGGLFCEDCIVKSNA